MVINIDYYFSNILNYMFNICFFLHASINLIHTTYTLYMFASYFNNFYMFIPHITHMCYVESQPQTIYISFLKPCTFCCSNQANMEEKVKLVWNFPNCPTFFISIQKTPWTKLLFSSSITSYPPSKHNLRHLIISLTVYIWKK